MRDDRAMADELRYEIVEGEQVLAAADDIAALCHVLFPDFTDGYLLDRLPTVTCLTLIAARGPNGALLGFKLGYQSGEGTFYSWLGGIHPSIQRQGVGRELMQRQHSWAREHGYAFVETRTRTINNAMIILNLQSGFHIVDFEDDGIGQPTVTQRASLQLRDLDTGAVLVEAATENLMTACDWT
jgi:GNAT superfamily N-acetyltransferase